MARRRMFSKDIVRSDTFLSMSLESCLLYFQLGMEADDRGYINNMNTVIKITGASNNALKELMTNKFILKRGETLYLIKGWCVNNTIQPSRLVESKYIEDLKKLFFDVNKSYTTNETPTPCLSTQKSKRKDKEKERKVEESEVEQLDWDKLMSHFED